MAKRPRLSHVSDDAGAHMVDVGAKPVTARRATAEAVVSMKPSTLAGALAGKLPKGPVWDAARLAGILAAKRTWDLIPLCHQIPLEQVDIAFDANPVAGTVTVTARVRASARTGVEMEALAAAAVAALTIYDMCKAAQKGITIERVRLLEKKGGRGASYEAAQ